MVWKIFYTHHFKSNTRMTSRFRGKKSPVGPGRMGHVDVTNTSLAEPILTSHHPQSKHTSCRCTVLLMTKAYLKMSCNLSSALFKQLESGPYRKWLEVFCLWTSWAWYVCHSQLYFWIPWTAVGLKQSSSWSEDSSEGTVSSSMFSSIQGNLREVTGLLGSFIDRNSLLGTGNGTKALWWITYSKYMSP